MTAKKFNLKDFLINNGIIVVLVLLAIYTGIMQPTFVSGSNLKNIALNVAPRFIIDLRRIRVSDHQRYRPFSRTYGRFICLLSRYFTSESGLQRQVLP